MKEAEGGPLDQDSDVGWGLVPLISRASDDKWSSGRS